MEGLVVFLGEALAALDVLHYTSRDRLYARTYEKFSLA